MKEPRNITFHLPADLIRRAKVVAAKRHTSLNTLVREALVQIVDGPTSTEKLENAWSQLRRTGYLICMQCMGPAKKSMTEFRFIGYQHPSLSL